MHCVFAFKLLNILENSLDWTKSHNTYWGAENKKATIRPFLELDSNWQSQCSSDRNPLLSCSVSLTGKIYFRKSESVTLYTDIHVYPHTHSINTELCCRNEHWTQVTVPSCVHCMCSQCSSRKFVNCTAGFFFKPTERNYTTNIL